MDQVEDPRQGEESVEKSRGSKISYYIVVGICIVVGVFVLSLFIAPLLHPDHLVTKVGIITNVATSGDPYFNGTVYTLTFQDGDVIRVKAAGSVPFPVGKPIAVSYSARESELRGVNLIKSR